MVLFAGSYYPLLYPDLPSQDITVTVQELQLPIVPTLIWPAEFGAFIVELIAELIDTLIDVLMGDHKGHTKVICRKNLTLYA